MGYTFRNCSWDHTTASVSANATQEVLHMCHGEWLEAASSPSGRQFQAKSTSPLWGLMVPLFCYLGLLSTTNIMGQHYKRALSLITLLPDFLAKDTWKKNIEFQQPLNCKCCVTAIQIPIFHGCPLSCCGINTLSSTNCQQKTLSTTSQE